jgi:hypothetical protein
VYFVAKVWRERERSARAKHALTCKRSFECDFCSFWDCDSFDFTEIVTERLLSDATFTEENSCLSIEAMDLTESGIRLFQTTLPVR